LVKTPKSDIISILEEEWRKNYKLDLSIITRDSENGTMDCTRHIFDRDFTGSQLNLVPKLRWNFMAADWKSFASDIDQVVV
jgi:hypothetical protein